MPSSCIMFGSMPIFFTAVSSMPIRLRTQGSIVPPIMSTKVEESMPICSNMRWCIMLPLMPFIME
eukprot:2209263-Alexandrium_andersonii.AAC.1